MPVMEDRDDAMPTADLLRRGLVTGAALAGAGALAASTARPAHAEGRGRGDGQHAQPHVLRPGDDWSEVLARTAQVQLVGGETYTLRSPVELPDGARILGNGAIVTTADTSRGAFLIDGVSDVVISDVRFQGEDAGSAHPGRIDVPFASEHVAVRIRRAANVRILDCDLVGWRGAGIVLTGSTADDYFSYGHRISGCRFARCRIGVSATDRAEFSTIEGSFFTACRLAVWQSAGNWTLSGCIIVGCYGAYYSIAATSPYGQADSDNWNHGTLVGCTLNHSNTGAKEVWTQHLEMQIGGESLDPGRGVVVQGLLPPTTTGCTLWYTDVRGADLQGSGWILAGCTLSDLTITGEGEVPIRLVGHQANSGDHAPRLIGAVEDALA